MNRICLSQPRRHLIATSFLLFLYLVLPLAADDRRFTYSYEPETPPQGLLEYEQWITLRTQRTSAVGQENYNDWRFRHEFEYGVTDRYAVGLYLNTRYRSFTDPATEDHESSFDFDGVSVENRYMLLNPAEKAVGLTFYLEPTFSGDAAELEEKILIGQRYGAWKWVLNLGHATEWEDDFHEVEGELDLSAGVSYDLGKRFSLGLEVRNVTVFPEYEETESTALYVGPVISYRTDKWWLALTVMPQVYGVNYGGNPDHNTSLDLAHNEKFHVRVLFGINL
jgi:hypothetical protein